MGNETHRGEPPPAAPESKDFKRLRESGETAGIGHAIGAGFIFARDALARALIRIGATPNRVTFLGFLMTVGAGYCLARGASQQVPYFRSGPGLASWWPFWAGVFLILACACDMLDGAVARIGNMGTKFGGILDSTLDRFSDMALYVGCALHFGFQGNLTYQLLAILALCATFLISYVKARAEEVIPDCSAGYWLRGERSVGLLVGCFTGHIPALLWQQSLLTLLTVWRRISYSYWAVLALESGRPAPPAGPTPGWRGWLQPWRHPRGSIPHDLVSAFNIGYIIFAARIWPQLLATGPWADPLGRWLGY